MSLNDRLRLSLMRRCAETCFDRRQQHRGSATGHGLAPPRGIPRCDRMLRCWTRTCPNRRQLRKVPQSERPTQLIEDRALAAGTTRGRAMERIAGCALAIVGTTGPRRGEINTLRVRVAPTLARVVSPEKLHVATSSARQRPPQGPAGGGMLLTEHELHFTREPDGWR